MAKNRSRNAVRLNRHSRIRKKVQGTSERPRLNVYRSLSQIYAQVIDDESGITLVSASTIDKDLRKIMKDLNPTEQARIVGKTLADRANEKGVQQVTFDRGGYRYIGRVKALAESARESGLEF
jgi:large subunit ribosomal protein L18